MGNTKVDLSYLETFSGGDKMLITEMMDRFLLDAPEQLRQIGTDIDGGKYKEAYKSLHNFKSSVNFIAVQSIKDLVLEMEKIAKSESDVSVLSEKFELLSLECQLLIDEIKAILKK